MKSEELRHYEEEFQAMREMLGTYCLELGRPSAEAETLDEKAQAGPPPTESATPSGDEPPRTAPEPSRGGN